MQWGETHETRAAQTRKETNVHPARMISGPGASDSVIGRQKQESGSGKAGDARAFSHGLHVHYMPRLVAAVAHHRNAESISGAMPVSSRGIQRDDPRGSCSVSRSSRRADAVS